MNKEELVELLQSLEIPVNEGESSILNGIKYPRIVFYEYLWEDVQASSNIYDTVVTYQISFFSKVPRHKKLIELKKKLNEKGIMPSISHEFIKQQTKDANYYHSYFAVDVIEDVTEDGQ